MMPMAMPGKCHLAMVSVTKESRVDVKGSLDVDERVSCAEAASATDAPLKKVRLLIVLAEQNW